MDPFHPEHIASSPQQQDQEEVLQENEGGGSTAAATAADAPLVSPSPSPSAAVDSLAATGVPPSASPPAGGVSVLVSPASRLLQLRAAIASWRVVDLDGRRGEIDSRALSMADEEERAVVARRALADSTRAWKRLASEEEKCAAMGPVVKAYQEEINQLTRRAKASEGAFLQLYRLLHDAPDPAQLLSAAATQIDSLQRADDELRAAKTTLAEYEAEFSGLKDQSVTIRKLEGEKREMESNLRAMVAAQLAERARDSDEELQAARRAFDEREQQLTDKLHSYKEQLAAALSAQSQLASAALSRDRHENERAELAASSDLRMLEEEVERQAMELGRKDNQLDALRAQLRALEEAPHAHARHDEAAALAADRTRLEEEVATLQARVDSSDSAARDAQSRSDHLARALAAAQHELARVEEDSSVALGALRAELAEQPSRAQFEEMKRQLLALQEIQYSSRHVDTETDSDATSLAGAAAGPSGADSRSPSSPSATSATSQLLLAKARRLEAELTTLKLTNSTLESAARTAAAEAETLQEQLVQSRLLVARLEEDLATANSTVVPSLLSRATATVAATAAAPKHLPSDFLSGGTAGTGTAPGGPLGSLTPAGAKMLAGEGAGAGWAEGAGAEGQTVPAAAAPTPVMSGNDSSAPTLSVDVSSSGEQQQQQQQHQPALISSLQSQLSQCSSMLNIVLGQRDRYRAKLESMETDKVAAVAACERARVEAATLRKDNLALYEKMQFVKSFSGGQHAAGGPGGLGQHRGDFVAAGSDGADIESGFGGVGSGALTRPGGGGGDQPGSTSSSSGGGGGDSEGKYAALYEARLNPFQAFKKRARAEREKNLSQSERVALAVGRALFSKKIARTALFAYALVLHLLVMVVLWTHTVADHCGTEGAGAASKTGAHQH